MIKFFRRIRYDLMEINKTGKYLKYAIGEIILVVIGILVALQINNYNEYRKDRNKEQIILKQLKEDYEANLEQLEQKMEMRNIIVNSAFNIFKFIDHPDKVNRDSLIINIANICNDPTFDPIQNDLISSGNLRLISNERLKRLLSNWSSEVVAVQEVELIWSNKVHQQLGPVMGKLGITRDVTNSFWKDTDQLWLLEKNQNTKESVIGTSKLNVPVKEILSSRELEGLSAMGLSLNTAANLQSETLYKRIQEILQEIENDIEEN